MVRQAIDPRDREPDPLLVEAAVSGRLWLSDLAQHERVYVVDQLTRRGESADMIASRLRCGKRVIQRIRASIRQSA